MLRLVAIVGLGLGFACSGQAVSSSDGREVYQAVCANCHGAEGKPDGLNAARGVHDLTAPEFRAHVTPAAVEDRVRHGSENKLMPAFDRALRPAQIKAVAAFVASPQFPH